ncbi:MurR/RpiR family transcriptional regulator [Halomonas salipaludis]|uniref:HTH rpiR-type domain-containing protein n=1 Tax=Halomonas salipaludis TaxID=2032625 RepID=A0A2A2EXY8_9GAMM|nr:MurR/RpiR family transcriptional regulator [Halomonas salipaludis]PAU77212.1 hypothetical protein CK498_08155 [Halomonas salipaludis]
MTIAECIHFNLDKFTASEKKAAKALMQDYPFIGLENLRIYAATADVSPPTILRMVSKLGLQGYAEFQRKLRNEVHDKLQSPLTLIDQARDELHPNETINSFTEKFSDNLQRTMGYLNESDIKSAIELLAEKKQRIFIVGGRFSHAIAVYLHVHLREIRDKVILLEGQSACWPEFLIDLKKGDAFICFDMRRYQNDMLRISRVAHSNGATILLFTDQWMSPISSMAKHTWCCHIDTSSPFDSYLTCVAVIDFLVAQLSLHFESDVKRRIAHLETLRENFSSDLANPL